MTSRMLWLGAVVAGLFAAAPARACNVPVFRYALERWPADPYEISVIHRGPLTGDDKTVVDALVKLADGEPARANFALNVVDLNKDSERALALLFQARPEYARQVQLGGMTGSAFAVALATLPDTQLPLLIVRYPEAARNSATVWDGRLDGATARALLDSPARRELVKRVIAGESGVWILLEGSDAQKNEAAAKLLAGELAGLQSTLKLPELTDDPEDKLSAKGPALKLAFSVVRVRRDDPAERFFVRSLLQLETDLEGRSSDPMAFAVFGRGRCLPPLIGAGITPQNLAADARFITGPCTCKVKKDNPGTDLLVLADWEDLIEGRAVKDAPLPPLTGLTAAAPESQPAGGVSAEPNLAEVCGGCNNLLRNVLMALGGGLVVVALVGFSVLRRRV